MISSIAEPLRRAHRVAHRVQPGPDLGEQRGRVIGLLQVGAVGGLDAALDRQRAPVGRRPGPAPGEPVPVGQARPADAEDAPDDDLGAGHAGLVDGG